MVMVAVVVVELMRNRVINRDHGDGDGDGDGDDGDGDSTIVRRFA